MAKQRRRLGEMSQAEQRRAHDAALAYLTEDPFDKAGAAAAAGIFLADLRELWNLNREEFEETEERYLGQLERLCSRAALGKKLDVEHEDFRLPQGIKMLEVLQRRRWGGESSKGASGHEQEAERLAREYEQRAERERAEAILSSSIKRRDEPTDGTTRDGTVREGAGPGGGDPLLLPSSGVCSGDADQLGESVDSDGDPF